MKQVLEFLKANEEKVSTWIGAGVAILIAVLFFTYFRSINKTGNGEITAQAQQTEQKTMTNLSEVKPEELPKEYEVQKGDNLWNISEKVYGNGYLWTEVYSANKEIINNPDSIDAGIKLTLPKLQVKVTNYEVKAGDSLSKIVVSTCGSGYGWKEAATANHLANPSMIYPGQSLKISCRI